MVCLDQVLHDPHRDELEFTVPGFAEWILGSSANAALPARQILDDWQRDITSPGHQPPGPTIELRPNRLSVTACPLPVGLSLGLSLTDEPGSSSGRRWWQAVDSQPLVELTAGVDDDRGDQPALVAPLVTGSDPLASPVSTASMSDR